MELFRGKSGIVPPAGITIYAAVNNLWQALNDTPISTPTVCQLRHVSLPPTAHQFLDTLPTLARR